MPTRQERRRQERLEKKQEKGERRYEMEIHLIQLTKIHIEGRQECLS